MARCSSLRGNVLLSVLGDKMSAIQAICANIDCGKLFVYRHGPAAYAVGLHYCSAACRNKGRVEKIWVTCSNSLCAKKFPFKGGRSHLERSKEHYCCRACKNTTHGLAGTARHGIWERARKRANLNGITFTISVHDIPEIPEYCPVLGVRIKANTSAGPLDSSPSIDRLIPSRGYVPGNIRIICNRANRIRSDATAEELRRIAEDALALEKVP